VLIAAAPLAVAAVLITGPATPALACAAATTLASAETLAKFTSSAILANVGGGVTADNDRFPAQPADGSGKGAGPQGRRDSQSLVTAARSCIWSPDAEVGGSGCRRAAFGGRGSRDESAELVGLSAVIGGISGRP
jgi:hypothetical protein